MKFSLVSLFSCCLLANASSAQSKTLDIYWIDVEGGAATLIVTPTGESILIDVGGTLRPARSQIAMRCASIKLPPTLPDLKKSTFCCHSLAFRPLWRSY